MSKYTCTMIGGGELGSCLAKIFTAAGHTVYVWDIDPNRRNTKKELKDMLYESAGVYVTVPSWAVSSALKDIRDHMRQDAYVVCASKGMMEDGRTMYHVMNEMLHNPYGLLAGPMIAEELVAGKSGYGVIAGNDDVCKFVSDMFSGTRVIVSTERDIESTAYASVLKNIYAVVSGMLDGWEVGDNVRGYAMAKMLQEWDVLADGIGINKWVLWGTAGEADFIATSISTSSRNRMMGEQFVKTGSSPLESEGTRSLAGMIRLLKSKGLATPPILAALYNVYVHHQSSSELLGALNVWL